MLRAIEIIILIIVVWIIVSQIIWPSLRGGRLFPIMRHTEAAKEAARALSDAHEISDEAAAINDLARNSQELQAAHDRLQRARGETQAAPASTPSTTNS